MKNETISMKLILFFSHVWRIALILFFFACVCLAFEVEISDEFVVNIGGIIQLSLMILGCLHGILF